MAAWHDDVVSCIFDFVLHVTVHFREMNRLVRCAPYHMIATAAEVLATTQASPPLWGGEHAEFAA
jgi:hypothetical protein